eukprot:3629917-Pyramimonas_sp.AAC.1
MERRLVRSDDDDDEDVHTTVKRARSPESSTQELIQKNATGSWRELEEAERARIRRARLQRFDST